MIGGLEALAGRLACERISEAELAEIEVAAPRDVWIYLHRNLHDYFRCNQAIHQKIVDAARNNALRVTYATLGSQIQRFRYTANLATSRDRWAEAVREHETILDALRRRAGDELSDILFRHLRNKQQVVDRRSSRLATPRAASNELGGSRVVNRCILNAIMGESWK